MGLRTAQRPSDRGTIIRTGPSLALPLLAGLLLTACGGGSSSGTTEARPALQGNLTTIGAASDGSLVKFDVDFDTLLYRWEGVEGPSHATVRQGTLLRRPEVGNHVYVTPSGGQVLVLPGKLAVHLSAEAELTAGVPRLSRAHDVTEIAGIYNFVSWDGSIFSYGVLNLLTRSTYRWWEERVGDGLPDETGRLSDQGNGVIYAHDDEDPTARAHAFLVYPSGFETFLVIADFAGGRVAVGVRQGNVPGLSGPLCTVASDASAPHELELTPPNLDGPRGERTYLYNVPWNGYAAHEDGLFADLMLPSPLGFVAGVGHEGFQTRVWFAVQP